jgi:hypothetical protein
MSATPESPRQRASTSLPLRFGLIAAAGLMALAFIAAPYSCEGGLAAYAWAGLLTLAGCGALGAWQWIRGAAPLGMRRFVPMLIVAASWLLGLLLADFRLLCRLF